MSQIALNQTARAAEATRTICGISVRFYKRGGANWMMDFLVLGQRVQRSTGWPTLKDAERVAAVKVRELKERMTGLTQADAARVVVRGRMATAGEVIAAMDSGAKFWADDTARTYKSALRSLARVVREDWHAAPIDGVLSVANIERFFARGQGRATVNWSDHMDCNGGLNTVLRNVKAIFKSKAVRVKFADIKLPDLSALRAMDYLKHTPTNFVPWPAEVYDRFDAACAALREAHPELWLVGAMLRRLGLRVDELVQARREWIERLNGEWCLNICNRGGDWPFAVQKNGRGRVLKLDEELAAILTAREGFLILPDAQATVRSDFVCRDHSAFVRQFIPDRAKSNHELRMLAGSIYYTRTGNLPLTSYFLGHKSLSTTETYYARILRPAESMDGAAVASLAC